MPIDTQSSTATAVATRTTTRAEVSAPVTDDAAPPSSPRRTRRPRHQAVAPESASTATASAALTLDAAATATTVTGANVDAEVDSAPSHEQLFVEGCDKRLPAWGVTRQFDFGQFVMLNHSETTPNGTVTVPVVVCPDGSINDIDDPDDADADADADAPVPGAAPAAPAVAPAAAGAAVEPAPPEPPAGKPVAHQIDPRSLLGPGAATGRRRSLVEALGGVPLSLVGRVSDPVTTLAKAPTKVEILDLGTALGAGSLMVGGKRRFPQLDDDAKRALIDGRSVTVLSSDRADLGAATAVQMLRLAPKVISVALTAARLDDVLATRKLTLPGNQWALDCDAQMLRNLTEGRATTVVSRMPNGTVRTVRVLPPTVSSAVPMSAKFTIFDLPSFLASPVVPALDSGPLDVPLAAATIAALRTTGTATVRIGATEVQLALASPELVNQRRGAFDSSGGATPTRALIVDFSRRGISEVALRSSGPGLRLLPRASSTDWGRGGPFEMGPQVPELPFPGSGAGPGGGPGGGPGSGPGGGPGPNDGPWPLPEVPLKDFELDARYLQWLEFVEQMRHPRFGAPPGGSPHVDAGPPGSGAPDKAAGLPVALLLPWRQQWILRGCSRGNLLSSIALAPGETRTIRMYSWERNSKALEQSTETETEQVQDFTSTTRDTEDVFREMTASQDFNAQAHGEVDASYNNGVASISASAGGNLTDASSLEQVSRRTTTRMAETVRHASAKVRSRRITKITESQEAIRGDEVIRVVRNQNQCRTLTLDYYEQLAHYTVHTKFVEANVKVVVMVPNPLRDTVLDNLTVRTNETAFRQALLAPDLSGGFAACRLLASYEHAWKIAEDTAAASKKVAELDREREVPPAADPATPKHPPNPHEAPLRATIKQIQVAADPVLKASITGALDAISKWEDPSGEQQKSGRRWLWRRLVETRIGMGFLNALAAVKADSSIDDVRLLVEAMPMSAFPGLGDMHSLKDTEKEDGALSAEFHARMGAAWDWGWWCGNARKYRLYDPDDNGLAAACARLADLLRDYDTKASEGDAVLAQQEMLKKANEAQTAANWVDKLEMKYGLDEVADARERQDALLAHLNAHGDYYRYVLFQALPPGEQLASLTAAAPALGVGFFEPRVVAHKGDQLAVPLSPTGKSELENLVKDIAATLASATKEALETAKAMEDDDIILPTPGLTVETSIGKCVGCEPHQLKLQGLERARLRTNLRLSELEIKRRVARLAARETGPFDPPGAPVSLDIRVEDRTAAVVSPVGVDDLGGVGG